MRVEANGCVPPVASPGKDSMTLARWCHVLNRKSTNFSVCVVCWPEERWLCVVKAPNEKTFCARNVLLSHFISQAVPSWNLKPNSRRVKTDCTHKGKDKLMAVKIFISVSETSAKANRKQKITL